MIKRCLFCKDKIKTSHFEEINPSIFAHRMCADEWRERVKNKPKVAKPKKPKKAKKRERLTRPDYKPGKVRRKWHLCRVCNDPIQRRHFKWWLLRYHEMCFNQSHLASEKTASEMGPENT